MTAVHEPRPLVSPNMRLSRRIIFVCNVILILIAILLITGVFVRIMIFLDVLPTPP